MSIDPKRLRELSSQHQSEERTVKALVYGIHKTSPWRDLISLESAVLPPIPMIKNKRWILHALLALPVREQLSVKGYMQPWGMISWSWPEGKIIQVIDLHLQENGEGSDEQETIPNIPAAETNFLTLVVQTKREHELFSKLDRLLAIPPTNEVHLQQLGGFYSGLLPRELYEQYWIRFPSTRTWLKLDAPLNVGEENQKKGNEWASIQRNEVLVEEETTEIRVRRDSAPKKIQSEQAKEETEQKMSPKDLSPLIGDWWQRTAKLAEACQAQEIIKQLREIEARLSYPGFRLAVVGEFNRGKSTLINLLLQRVLVPVGAIPTTTAVTSIIYSEQESMHVQFPDGKSEQRALVAASWSDLVATKQEKNKQQIVAFPKIRIMLSQTWLREVDIEIIDTPGVNDPYGARSALALDVLSNADAALLLIAAHSPLSLTETIFLEQEVLGRHIPHVIVVVSMLDRIEEEQRAIVMDDIREKVSAISRQIPVVSTQEIGGKETTERALANVKGEIQEIAGQGERRAWRSQQIANQLADFALNIADLGEVAERAKHLGKEKRIEELRDMQDNVRRGELEWEIIEIELKKRAGRLEQELQKRLDTAKGRILETVLFDLSKTHDPKIWWEQDLPFRMHQHFLGVAREIEPFVLGALGQDMQWLQVRVQKAFQINMHAEVPQIEQRQDIVMQQEQLEIADIQRIRLFSRIGSGAATVVGYLLLGPVGSAISIAGGIITDQTLANRVKEQQKQIAEEVKVSIERSLRDYFERFLQRLEELYERMLNELRQQQRSWEAGKTRILQNSMEIEQGKDWQSMIEEAKSLYKEISKDLVG